MTRDGTYSFPGINRQVACTHEALNSLGSVQTVEILLAFALDLEGSSCVGFDFSAGWDDYGTELSRFGPGRVGWPC